MSDPPRALQALLELMARLRDPDAGCPWDREQTFATIAPYTLEEAYEVADAIEQGDPERLRDELGDLLFQVVFHARMAQERGWFDFADVAAGIHEKLVRRHPHVFAGARFEGAAQQSQAWEEQKAHERRQAARARGAHEPGMLDDVPRALPALTRAAKLGKRAARAGLDWTRAAEVREKVAEELRELDAALEPRAGAATADDEHVAEELGDVLFALANWARHLRLDPEATLRSANAKFERRFRHIEGLARERHLDLRKLSPAEWEGLWQEAKRATDRARGASPGT